MAKTLLTLATTTSISDGALFLLRNGGDTVDKAVSMANIRLALARHTKCVYATDYGVKADGIVLKDVNITNGSAIISSAGYTFTSADIGKVYALRAGPTYGTYQTRGTIIAVNGNQATLSANSTSTVSNNTAELYFGTDDTTALQTAIDAVNPEDTLGTGSWKYRYMGVVVTPVSMMMITHEIEPRPGVSICAAEGGETWLKWVSTNTMAASGYYAMFHGGKASGSNRIYKDIHMRGLHIDMTAAFTTTYSYHAKCVEIIYIYRSSFTENYFNGSPATSLGMDYVADTLVHGNTFFNSGRLWTSGGGGGSSIDFQTSDEGLYDAFELAQVRPQAVIIANNFFFEPMVSAVRFTNNTISLTTQVPIIMGNVVVTTKTTTTKGIEDNAGTGAIIIGNTLVHKGTQTTEGTGGTESQHYWAGITSLGGQYGVIANNTIIGGWYHGIALRRFTIGASVLAPSNYLVTGNSIKGSASHGIHTVLETGYTLANTVISNNRISNTGAAGIYIGKTDTTGTINRVSIKQNVIYDVGATTVTDIEKSAMLIDSHDVNGLMVDGNNCYDTGGATTKYGITVNDAAITNAFVTGNDFSGVTTTAINYSGTGSISGSIVNNKGYQLGAASVSPGASPWTYTAGNTPEVIYISDGTVSGITKNSVALPVNQPIYLNPGEQIVVTYSVAPTVVKDRK